jgi:hypothetical protein
MKQVLLALTAILLTQISYSQVAISNPASNPDASAMLDVKSTNKGFLMPRVANRTNVASPATGLMVYETASNSVLVYNGTAWTQLGSGGGSSQWLTNGTHIYNGNTGNVGIGVSAPSSKFHLLGDMVMDGTSPILQFQQSGVNKGFVQLTGDYLRLGTNSANNSGRIVMRLNNIDRVIVDSTGNMRIDGSEDASLTKNGYLMLGSENGTNLIFDNNEMMARNGNGTADLVMQNDGGNVGIGTSPNDKLDVNGSMRLTGESRQFKFETGQAGGGVTKYAPGIHFLRSDNTRLGILEYVDTVGTNFLRLRTGSTITNDLVVTTGHDICIGGSNPNAKLEVRGVGEVMRIHAAVDPLLQFSTGNATGVGIGLPLERKGFLDVNGDDFRIGTNSSNDAGKFIVRVNGGDVVNVTPAFNVGVGTATPTAKLHVVGKIFANAGGEAIRLEGTDPAINFFQSGTQRAYIWQTGNNLQIGNSIGTGKIIVNTSKMEIGTSVGLPDGYRLGIGGKVLCEELKVKLQNSGWPDYVFTNNYKLMPLADLQNFITKNNHLPNIPKASVIEKEGLEVGEMQRKLMEKVEELTLYILDLQKQIDELKKKNRSN